MGRWQVAGWVGVWVGGRRRGRHAPIEKRIRRQPFSKSDWREIYLGDRAAMTCGQWPIITRGLAVHTVWPCYVVLGGTWPSHHAVLHGTRPDLCYTRVTALGHWPVLLGTRQHLNAAPNATQLQRGQVTQSMGQVSGSAKHRNACPVWRGACPMLRGTWPGKVGQTAAGIQQALCNICQMSHSLGP